MKSKLASEQTIWNGHYLAQGHVLPLQWKVQSQHKCLGDSVGLHPIQNMGLWLCKLPITPTRPLTAQWEMSLVLKEAIIILVYLRYCYEAISPITGRPRSTVPNFVAGATGHQFLENNACRGGWCIVTYRQSQSIMRTVKNDRQIRWAELCDMYALHESLSTIDQFLCPNNYRMRLTK